MINLLNHLFLEERKPKVLSLNKNHDLQVTANIWYAKLLRTKQDQMRRAEILKKTRIYDMRRRESVEALLSHPLTLTSSTSFPPPHHREITTLIANFFPLLLITGAVNTKRSVHFPSCIFVGLSLLVLAFILTIKANAKQPCETNIRRLVAVCKKKIPKKYSHSSLSN